MNPRSIPECIDAIRDLRGIDKAWLQYMTEPQLVPVIRDIVNTTHYNRYTIISDDCIPTQATLDLVLAMHDENQGSATCAWINVDNTGNMSTINPTPLANPDYPTEDAYNLLTIDEAQDLPNTPIRTYFHGCNLATLTAAQWATYPFDTYAGGWASDYHQCIRLQADDVPILTHPAAYMHHVKELQNALDQAPEKQLLIGKRTPRVTIEREI